MNQEDSVSELGAGDIVPDLPEVQSIAPDLMPSTSPSGRPEISIENLRSGIHASNQNSAKLHLPPKDATSSKSLVLPTGFHADHVHEMEDLMEQLVQKPELEDDRSFAQSVRQSRRAMHNANANPGVTALCAERGDELMESIAIGDAHARPGFIRRAARGTSNDAQLTRLGQISMTSRPATVPLGNSLLMPGLPELTADAMMKFYYTVTEFRTSYGRQAYGMLYSNASVLVYKALAEAILRPLLTFGNLRITPPTEVKDSDNPLIADPLHYIRAHDVDALLTMLAATYWPQGFDYVRNCVHCDTEHHRRVSIQHMLQYDSQRLSPASRTFLAQIAASPKPWDVVLEAQEQNVFNEGGQLNFVFGHGAGAVCIDFHVPSLAWQLQVGESFIQWVENLVPTADTLTNQALIERRSIVANMHRLRKVAHYIKSVTSYEPSEDAGAPKTGVVTSLVGFDQVDVIKTTDLRVLNEALARLSGDQQLVEAVEAYLEKMIARTTCNVVAVDSFLCNHCGKANMSDSMNSRWPNWLPVNALSCFFEFIEIEMQRRSTST